MKKLMYKNIIIKEFEKGTSPEEILTWVNDDLRKKQPKLIFGDVLFKLSKDKTKITHKTMVSYTELLIN